jgi:hypothetical protein
VATIQEFITVVDGSLRPVVGVRQPEVSVTFDGAVVPIRSWRPAGIPLSLVLLLDVSRSNYALRTSNVDHAVHRIDDAVAGNLRPEDRIRVGSIASTLQFHSGWTSHRAELGRAVRSAIARPESEREGPSPIWDMLWQTAEELEKSGNRRVAIVLTDGHATGNRYGFADVVKRALSADVAICGVGQGWPFVLRQGETLGAAVRPDAMLEYLSRESGCHFLKHYPYPTLVSGAPLNLEGILKILLRGLQASYLLDLDVPVVAGPRPLTVEVARVDAVTWHRRHVVARR